MSVITWRRESLSWLNDRKRIWRVIALAGLVLAFLGPWAFDRINVPAEFPCTRPHIRLEGDFCGLPLSGLWNLAALALNFISTIVGLITGGTVFVDWRLMLAYLLGAFLLVLPVYSTLLLIRAGERRSRQIFNAAAWGLALGVSLLYMSVYPYMHPALWGIWLYIGVAASALIVEALILRASRRLAQAE
jgi:hypothetical protein